MYEKEFEKLGLTKGESKVYSYLIKAGKSTTGPIVKNSKVAYSKVYEILERLIRKGLISFIIQRKTRYYKALQPSRIKEFLKKEKKKIEDKEELLNNLLPKLQNIKKDIKPSAEIYKGIKGIKTAYENLLEDAKKENTLRYFYSYKPETYEIINNFYYQLFPKIKKINILFKGIVNEKFKERFKEEKPPRFLKAKFVDFPVPSNIDIFNDKIMITIWEEEPLAILISSKEISDSFKQYFDDAWKTAKP